MSLTDISVVAMAVSVGLAVAVVGRLPHPTTYRFG
jgi:hypothetical protein